MQLDSNFWAAIVGAIVGGAIGLIGQWLVMRAAKKQRDEDREIARRALAHALLYKAIRIFTTNHHLLEYIEEGFQRAVEAKEPEEWWKYLTPLANFPDRIHFSPDEMTMLFGLKNNELFNQLVSLDAVHNSLVDGVTTYGDRKSAFTQLLPPATRFVGLRGSTALTEEQFRKLLPLMVELKALANDLRTRARSDYLASRKTLVNLDSELRSKLQMTHKLELPTQPIDDPAK